MLKAYRNYWRSLLDFSGRTNRKDYWSAILINLLISIILMLVLEILIANLINISPIDNVNKLLLSVLYQSILLFNWVAALGITVRRLHDSNRSGWWLLLEIIPVIGFIWLVVLTLLPSDPTALQRTPTKNSRYLILLLIGILIVAVVRIVESNYDTYVNEIYTAKQVPKWSADQEPLLTQAAFNQTVAKYSKNQLSKATLKKARTVIVPGLHGAWSLNYQTKKAAFGSNWIPQGLAENQQSYFISAYDGNHQLNSLIFVVDKSTGKYQKSLILPRKSHVGGLAVDEDHDLLWVSDDTNQSARIRAISFKQIDQYDAVKSQKPIGAKQIAPLRWASRSSGLVYFKNNLLIVKYGRETGSHSVVDIAVNAKTGLVQKSSMRTVKLTKQLTNQLTKNNSPAAYAKIMQDQKIIKSYTTGFKRMQGLAVVPFEDSSAVLTLYTQSNGQAASNLIINIADFNQQLDFNQIKKLNQPSKSESTIKLPPSVEQISVDPQNHKISLIFEGAAREYRNFNLGLFRKPFIDRLIIFDY